jgi:hypothetical protein
VSTSTDATAQPSEAPLPRVIVWGTLLLGALLWFVVAVHPARPTRFWVAAAIVLLLGLVPISRRLLDRAHVLLDRLPRFILPTIVLIAAWAALFYQARDDDRSFTPNWHDEFSYLFQAQTFATGRLWLPALPAEIRNAFDTFYVLTAPAYASQYFPGTAIFHVPGVLLNTPAWMTSLTLTSIAIALTFSVGRRTTQSNTIALACATLVACAFPTRLVSVIAIAQPPTMLLAGAVYVGYLARMQTPRRITLVIIGAATGWLLITRPIDALGLLGPIWTVIGWQVLRARSPARTRMFDITSLIAPVMPFVLLQLVINAGVTGRFMTTPFEYYAERDMKGFEWSLLHDAAWGEPVSVIEQKRRFYDTWINMIETRRVDRAARFIREAKYDARGLWHEAGAIVVLPIGVAALLLTRSTGRLAMPIVAGGALWVVLYLGYPMFLRHYWAAVVPAAATLTGVGLLALREHIGPALARAASGLIVVWCVMSLPILDRMSVEVFPDSPSSLAWTTLDLESTLPKREILLIVQSPTIDRPGNEVVFNWRAARLQDNRVVRCHDLGPTSNEAVVRYFAAIQPCREVFTYDRGTGECRHLGTAAEVAQSGFLKDR